MTVQVFVLLVCCALNLACAVRYALGVRTQRKREEVAFHRGVLHGVQRAIAVEKEVLAKLEAELADRQRQQHEVH